MWGRGGSICCIISSVSSQGAVLLQSQASVWAHDFLKVLLSPLDYAVGSESIYSFFLASCSFQEPLFAQQKSFSKASNPLLQARATMKPGQTQLNQTTLSCRHMVSPHRGSGLKVWCNTTVVRVISGGWSPGTLIPDSTLVFGTQSGANT